MNSATANRIVCFIKDPFLEAAVLDAALNNRMECVHVSDLGLIRLEEAIGSHKWLVYEANKPDLSAEFVKAYLDEFKDKRVVVVVSGAIPVKLEQLAEEHKERLFIIARSRFLVIAKRLFELGKPPEDEEFGPEAIKSFVELLKFRKEKESAQQQNKNSSAANENSDTNNKAVESS